MGKRAAIYIRVSSEEQAEEVSPEEQELDAKKLAAARGHTVVAIYRDTERYRVGRRLVQPSASRNDRPGWRKMLADADSGLFDVLIAWRDDRLYRGVTRATLDLTERVKAGVFSVELVNGHFDPTFAPVMAWAAGIELEAKADRHWMGVRGRLKQNKVWCSNPPYGYDLDQENGTLTVNEYEAYYVNGIKERAAMGQSPNEIRRWLISEGAQQKEFHAYHRKHDWSPRVIRFIINQEYYATGLFPVKWDGEVYHVQIQPIVPMDVQTTIDRRRSAYKAAPVGRVNKGEHLFVGKVFCQNHNVKMMLHRNVKTKQKTGWRKEYINYRCNSSSVSLHTEGCAKSVQSAEVEERAWNIIWDYISTPGALENVIQARIDELTNTQEDMVATITHLEEKLRELDEERQTVYTWARKGKISEDNMDRQLANIDVEEQAYLRELSNARLASQQTIGDLESILALARDNVISVVDILREAPLNDEDAERQFELKKQFIDNFIDGVYITKEIQDGYTGIGGFGATSHIEVRLSVGLGRYVTCEEAWK